MNLARWFLQLINELVEKTRIIILFILRFIFDNASERTKDLIFRIRNQNQSTPNHQIINTCNIP